MTVATACPCARRPGLTSNRAASSATESPTSSRRSSVLPPSLLAAHSARSPRPRRRCRRHRTVLGQRCRTVRLVEPVPRCPAAMRPSHGVTSPAATTSSIPDDVPGSGLTMPVGSPDGEPPDGRQQSFHPSTDPQMSRARWQAVRSRCPPALRGGAARQAPGRRSRQGNGSSLRWTGRRSPGPRVRLLGRRVRRLGGWAVRGGSSPPLVARVRRELPVAARRRL